MLNTVTSPCSLALAATRSAVGPGMGSARSRAAGYSRCCGKNRVSVSSGKAISPQPASAAVSIARRARSRLSLISGPADCWASAMRIVFIFASSYAIPVCVPG